MQAIGRVKTNVLESFYYHIQNRVNMSVRIYQKGIIVKGDIFYAKIMSKVIYFLYYF